MSEFPERMVYVDDENTIRNLVRELIDGSDYNTVLVTCSSGEELINRYQELQPDLILLDLMMPEMSGPDLIEKLLETEDIIPVPIIFMTGKDAVEMEEDYTHLGVIGVLNKPFCLKNLPENIKELWDAHHGVNEESDGASD